MLFKACTLLSLVLISSACNVEDYKHVIGWRYSEDLDVFTDKHETDFRSNYPGVRTKVIINGCYKRHDQEPKESKHRSHTDTLYLQVNKNGKIHDISCNKLPKEANCEDYKEK
jgi:hypothetical protein